MKRTSLILPFFRYLFTKPSVILKALFHGISAADRKDYVIKKYNLKSGLPEVSLLDLFPDFNEEIQHFTHLYGTSLPIDIAFLKKLAAKYKDCEYLEIGTWRGESIVNVATVAKTCYSLSLSDKEMNSIGYGTEYTRVQRFFSKNIPNIVHLEGNSMTYDFNSLNKKFDVIFIDGDHRYEGVVNDTQKMFGLLKDENSVIVWHDYAIQYEQIDWNVFSGILDGAPESKRKNIYHVSNTLCAIFTNQTLKTTVREFPAVPDKDFSIRINASKITKS